MRTVTRRFALWRADLDGGVCAAPEECVETLSGRDQVTVVLEHRGRQEFASRLRQDVEWQFDGIEWPADLRPGVWVTVSWRPAKEEIVLRTVLLEEPVRVDGVNYLHEYDPKVVTREFEAGASNRGKVLHAVRRHGRIYEDGSAVLAEPALPARCGLARGARNAFLLRNAVDQLIREGYLTRVPGSVDSSGYPAYPAVEGQKPADLMFYAPMVEHGHDPDEPGAERPEHWVTGFVRKLPPGAHASEKQLNLHEQAVEEDEVPAEPLAPGYTFVKKHHRG